MLFNHIFNAGIHEVKNTGISLVEKKVQENHLVYLYLVSWSFF